MAEKKITEEVVRAAYQVGREVHEKLLTRGEAVKQLSSSKYKVNPNSAGDLVDNVGHLIRGEKYVRTNNAPATEHFLQMIHRDYGSTGLAKAVSAVEKHLDYYAGVDNGSKQPGIQKLARRYGELLLMESPADGRFRQDLLRTTALLGEEGYFSLDGLVDERKRRIREVVERRGQSHFRRKLLAAYDSRCAVTSCDAEAALEASHIFAYCGPQSNHPSNGILLRADIHTLFDLDLLGFDPDGMTVIVGDVLRGTAYDELDGKRISLPADPSARPSREALQKRWLEFRESS